MRNLQNVSIIRVLWAAGVFVLATGCGQDPSITASLQEVTVLSGGEEVSLGVSVDAEWSNSLQWTATAGTLRNTQTHDSVSNDWKAPLCIPEGEPLPVVTVTLTDNKGRTASTEFHFEGTAEFRCAVTETAAMSRARTGHTATRLASGKVLVVGGASEYTTTRKPDVTIVGPSVFEASAELYDPSAGTWAPTGALSQPRWFHEAHLLPSGKVLVLGGNRGSDEVSHEPKLVTSVELYEPSTGTWTVASQLPGDLVQLRRSVLLASGKVLVLGAGLTAIYDPEANTWAQAASRPSGADVYDAIGLPSGKVLVAGRAYLIGAPTPTSTPAAWLYDVSTDSWARAGPLRAPESFFSTSLTLLPSGKVLFVYQLQGTTGSELYDPGTDTWAATAAPPYKQLSSFRATLVSSGKVLVTARDVPDWKLLHFNVETAAWAVAGSMPVLVPSFISATPLTSGQVLLVGGEHTDDALPATYPQAKAWVYKP